MEDLSNGDIAFCSRQSIALAHVIPIALDILVKQPLIEAELYPGDMLVSLLAAAKNKALNKVQLQELYDICANAAAGALTISETVLPAAADFIAERNEKI